MKQWTQEKIQEATESFYARHHRYPKASEYHSGNGLPSYSTIRMVMQMTAAEYLRTFFPQDPQNDKALWSQDSILRAIQQFLQINGTLPKYYDFYSENGFVTALHVAWPGVVVLHVSPVGASSCSLIVNRFVASAAAYRLVSAADTFTQ